MIREAKFADVPALTALIEEAYGRSKYVGRGAVDAKEAKGLLMRALQRQGAPGVGGSTVLVAEGADGIAGFMIGLLDRCYHVGDRLVAQDLFLYANETAPRFAALELMQGYVAWAEANPKVIQVVLSATDAVGDFHRVERLYRRLGFQQAGVIYEREVA